MWSPGSRRGGEVEGKPHRLAEPPIPQPVQRNGRLIGDLAIDVGEVRPEADLNTGQIPANAPERV